MGVSFCANDSEAQGRIAVRAIPSRLGLTNESVTLENGAENEAENGAATCSYFHGASISERVLKLSKNVCLVWLATHHCARASVAAK